MDCAQGFRTIAVAKMGAAAFLALAMTWVTPSTFTMAQAQSPRQQDLLLESLRREVSDKLLASGKISSVQTVEPLVLRAKKLAGGEVTINIHNVLGDVTAKPADRSGIVQRFVAAALMATEPVEKRIPRTKEQFIAALRLLVRHSDSAKPVPGTDGKPALIPLSRPLTGDAHMIVVFDTSETLVFATPGVGRPHDLTDEALYDLALAETQKLKSDVTSESLGPLRYFATSDGPYSPSLLLVEEHWIGVERDLGPGFLVAIPDRTVLLAAPQKNAAELMRAVQSVAQQRKSAPHIPHLIQRTAGGWQRFK
jgi:hypothetical protein